MRFALAVGLSLAIYLSLNNVVSKTVNAMSLAATEPGAQPLGLRLEDTVAAQAKKASTLPVPSEELADDPLLLRHSVPHGQEASQASQEGTRSSD